MIGSLGVVSWVIGQGGSRGRLLGGYAAMAAGVVGLKSLVRVGRHKDCLFIEKVRRSIMPWPLYVSQRVNYYPAEQVNVDDSV